MKRLVLSLSDQQLLTGLAMLIAGFWTHCSISVYHFSLVNDLAWFSATVHFITLCTLQGHILARPILRDWRVALIIAMALLLFASTVMEGHHQWNDSGPYNAQCLFDDFLGNVGGSPRYWMSVNIIQICIYYPLAIIPLYERPTALLSLWFETKPRAAQGQAIESLKEKISHTTSPISFQCSMKRFGYTLVIGSIGMISSIYFALLALLTSRTCMLALGISWFVISLWTIKGDRNVPPSEMNGSENSMSFGQIVPILLLSSIVLVFIEAYESM